MKERAYELLRQWKGTSYRCGCGVMEELGAMAARYGSRALVVANRRHSQAAIDTALRSLERAGVTVIGGGCFPGARPNAPREDVYRLETYVLHHRPDCMVVIGSGSTIDACKAALVLAAYGRDYAPDLDTYFGTGLVSKAAEATGAAMLPLIAVETAASSGAHLTKYANVTDPVAGQKLLMVDPAITPPASLFDYAVTASMPRGTTVDGALDGIAHTFECFCGAKPETYGLLEQLAVTCLELTLTYLPKALEDPADLEAREALGLATDLGGYAIMVGGTSGAHLTSFSLVDVAAHGAACGLMNPYFAVFYGPAIQPQLLTVGRVLAKYGYLDGDVAQLQGRQRAEAVARGMMAFSRAVHAPVRLTDLPGFSEAHVARILAAAKEPSLAMKLQNMPVPMTADEVDRYMEPILRAAVAGTLDPIVERP